MESRYFPGLAKFIRLRSSLHNHHQIHHLNSSCANCSRYYHHTSFCAQDGLIKKDSKIMAIGSENHHNKIQEHQTFTLVPTTVTNKIRCQPISNNPSASMKKWQTAVHAKLMQEFDTHKRTKFNTWRREEAMKKAYFHIINKDIDSLLNFAIEHFEREQLTQRIRAYNNEFYLLVLKYVKSELEQMTANPNWAKVAETRTAVKRHLEKLLDFLGLTTSRAKGGESKRVVGELIPCLGGWIHQLGDASLATNYRVTCGIMEKDDDEYDEEDVQQAMEECEDFQQ